MHPIGASGVLNERSLQNYHGVINASVLLSEDVFDIDLSLFYSSPATISDTIPIFGVRLYFNSSIYNITTSF